MSDDLITAEDHELAGKLVHLAKTGGCTCAEMELVIEGRYGNLPGTMYVVHKDYCPMARRVQAQNN